MTSSSAEEKWKGLESNPEISTFRHPSEIVDFVLTVISQ